METLQFTKVGNTIAEFSWVILVVGIVSLFYPLKSKHRWSGRLTALGCAMGFTLGLPTLPCMTMIFALAGIGSVWDVKSTQGATTKQIRSTISTWLVVIGISAMPAFSSSTEAKEIWIKGEKIESSVGPDELNGAIRDEASHSANRRDIRPMVYKSASGKPYAWYFQKEITNGTYSDVTFTFSSEVYWDHQGHLLSGGEVAAEIQQWSGAKFRVDSDY